MEEMIAMVGTAVLGFGVFKYFKNSKAAKIAKETVEALSAIMSALKDGKLTAKEVKTLKKEIMDVVAAFKGK